MTKKQRSIVNPGAADLRTPKYRMRVVADKRKKADKEACRKKGEDK